MRGQRQSRNNERTCILGPRASTSLPHIGPMFKELSVLLTGDGFILPQR